jgi:hypothetical protein
MEHGSKLPFRLLLESDSHIMISKHSANLKTDAKDPDEGEQSPNEKFKSLLKRVVSLTPEQAKAVRRTVPVPKIKKRNHN